MTCFRFVSCIFILLFATASMANAIEGSKEQFAIGVILGDPTGLSGRAKFDGEHSVDAAIAGSTGRWPGLHLHADYLWDRAHAWETTQGPLFMYYGLGGRIISIHDDDSNNGKLSAGPRGSLGILYNFNNPNLELFGEGALILDIVPEIDVDLDIGIGLRIRF